MPETNSTAGNPSVPVPRAAATDRESAPVDPDFCAAVVIDAGGNIVAANRSACDLWGFAAGKSPVGFPFAALLESEDSPASDGLSWSTLLAAALNRWSFLLTRSVGAPPRAVRVRIERAVGGAGTYLATLQPRLP